MKEAEEHANAMSHANATLREASASSTGRISTLTESLKITSTKVATSRADADLARAKVSSLGTQIISLKSALDETKRVCESIRSEHDDIQSSARDLEAKLVQTESELQRIDKEKFEIKLERDELRHELEDSSNRSKETRLNLEKMEDEVHKLKKLMTEREDIERARSERTSRLENELRDTRSMQVEVTGAAKDAESTNADLQNTIQQMQRENKMLHDKIEEVMDSSRREKMKLQKEIGETESETQKLRMKVTIDEEELQKTKLDLSSSEKEISQVNSRLVDLEGKLRQADSSAGVVSPIDEIASDKNEKVRQASLSSYKTPGKTFVNTDTHQGKQFSKRTDHIQDEAINEKENLCIPPLRSVTPRTSHGIPGKELVVKASSNRNKYKQSVGGGNSSGSRLSSIKCTICFKNAYGIMKSCQCGKADCKKRAHASCIAGSKALPSVSHPGTPAPRLPCILCNL